MNREIKFRAWHTEANKMLTGSNADIFKWLEEGQPIKVMQFTGLHDKNGVEIYEGDIIQGEPIYGISHSAVRGCVSFSEENGAWMGYDLNANEGEFLYQIRKGCENFIVIGNIYQNPELIKTA